MSENINPEEIQKVLSDVEGQVDTVTGKAEQTVEAAAAPAVEAAPAEEAPVAEPVEPAAEPSEPAAEPSEPEAPAAEPEAPAAEPEAAPAEPAAEAAEPAAEEPAKADSFADKTLAELSDLFVQLKDSAERMARSKEAEAIKSAFYKLLGKLKGESGVSETEESSQNNPF